MSDTGIKVIELTNSSLIVAPSDIGNSGLSLQFKEQMLERIAVLSGEIEANLEENRAMQEEIKSLYAKIDSLKQIGQ